MKLGPPNKGMTLTKLSAAPLPDRRCRLMPAPVWMDAGTASQLIPGVGRTEEGEEGHRWEGTSQRSSGHA
jgi:hypothetical protein